MNQTIGMKILTPLCRKALLQLLQSALWEQTPQSEVFASMTAQDWELRHRAAAKTRLEQRPMTEEPRRYAS